MQGKHLYEYAILRVVPRVEREEFVNVGVLLCCKRSDMLCCRMNWDLTKVSNLDPGADLEIIGNYLKSIFEISQGHDNGSPIALQDAPSRFRWLTANRSSIIQTSRPHVGFAEDLQDELVQLYKQYVG